MLFLKLPFAFRPGLTSSRVSRAKNKKKLPGLAKVAVVDTRARLAGSVDIARLIWWASLLGWLGWPPANIALCGLNCHVGQKGHGGGEYQFRNS